MIRTANRLEHIEPFYVMELAKAAMAIAESPACDPRHGGEPMVFLNIGEPDFTAARPVVQAAQRLPGAKTNGLHPGHRPA